MGEEVGNGGSEGLWRRIGRWTGPWWLVLVLILLLLLLLLLLLSVWCR